MGRKEIKSGAVILHVLPARRPSTHRKKFLPLTGRLGTDSVFTVKLGAARTSCMKEASLSMRASTYVRTAMKRLLFARNMVQHLVRKQLLKEGLEKQENKQPL